MAGAEEGSRGVNATGRDLTAGELRRLQSEWKDGYLTRGQLCARFRISDRRLLELCAGLPRQTQANSALRQSPRIARALV